MPDATITQTAIYASVLLSYIAYTDEADTGDQAAQIATTLRLISSKANGPFTLTWGPVNNLGILAFVAQGADDSFTLTLRGTVTDESASGAWSNVIDDLDVTEQVPFPYPLSEAATIAQGSMTALEALITATDPSTDTCLMDYLRMIPATTDATLTINVTGHSLGADLANIASAWLVDQYPKATGNNTTLVLHPTSSPPR